MSRYLNCSYKSLSPYVPGEIPRDRVVLKLNTNESPFPPSPGVLRCFNEENGKSQRLYGDPSSRDLNRAIAGAYGVRSENIISCGGSDEVLELAFLAYGQDGIVCPDVTYGFYPVLTSLHHIDLKTVPLEEDFSVNIEDYAAAGRAVVLANPNAPTGLYLGRDAIEALVRSNPDHVVIIDEAYVDFGNETMIPLTKEYDNLLVVQTFSKSRSLAGARIGFACGNEELIEDLERLRNSRNPYNVTRLSQLLGIAAVMEAAYYRDNIMKIVQNRDWTMRRLRELGFDGPESGANFVMVKHKTLSGDEVNRKLREKGILVRHFTSERIRDYNRITIGTRQDMEQLIHTLKEIVNGSDS